MKQIFRFTPEGEEWIDGYDFRQMIEQPAWFGSFGYQSWAGAGEAVPRSVLHEMSHSYWGAFSVDKLPQISWDTSNGTPQGLLHYREQLRLFMLQPPDRFEPLRDRFRNLPGLSRGEYPDIAHFGEAELLYMTGGNMQLVPPILKPFYSAYLEDGGAGAEEGLVPASWDEAMSWFNSLSSDDRRIAGEVFGLQHFPSGRYLDLPETQLRGIDEQIRTLYENEERQRLIDFEAQFDGILDREFSLVDAAGADRGFDFWRSYLSDKLDLHRRHPDVLNGIGTVRGGQLAEALDFYDEISSQRATTQTASFREASDRPLVPELAVLLRPRAIVELFSEPGSAEGIAAVLGGRADRLTDLVAVVDETERALELDGLTEAATVLERFIISLLESQFRADAFLLLDLLRSSDGNLARRVLPELSNGVLRYVLEVQPAFARSFEIGPERLLEAVGIGEDASLEDVGAGAAILAANSSGNFAIDAAYDSAVFDHLDRFVDSDPAGVLSVLTESEVRLVPWLDRRSDGAITTLRSAQEAAGDLLVDMIGIRETPWRIIHLVAKEDPELAAVLTLEMEEILDRSDRSIERAIREFGYDLYWSERNAGPNVEPQRLAEFLIVLNERLPEGELVSVLSNVIRQYEAESRRAVAESDALVEFRRTVDAGLDSVSSEDAELLRSLFVAAERFD